MSLIIGLILGAGVVIFAAQNFEPVMVSFLGWSFEGSIALIVILALLAGVIISMLFSIPSFIRNALAESKLKGHNEALRRELDDHKIKLGKAEQKIVDAETMPEKVIITKL